MPVAAATPALLLFLWNEVAFDVLMDEQHTVIRPDAGVAVHAHAGLEHIGAGRQLTLFSAVERVAPRSGHVDAVIVARVGMDGRDESCGDPDQHRILTRVAVAPQDDHLY